MDKALESAAAAVAELVTSFVEAADRLVNLLSGEAYSEAEKDEAMNAYDRARRALTGEDVSSA